MFSFAVDPQAILTFAAMVAAPFLLPMGLAVIAAIAAWRAPRPTLVTAPPPRPLRVVRDPSASLTDRIAVITGTVATVN